MWLKSVARGGKEAKATCFQPMHMLSYAALRYCLLHNGTWRIVVSSGTITTSRLHHHPHHSRRSGNDQYRIQAYMLLPLRPT